MFATEEWLPKKFGMLKYGSAGVSAADYDGDGWYDLYFADGASARLYRNLGDGTFADATAAAGLPVDLHGINVALFVDLDNDGDQDLFLGRFTGDNRLYRNDGDGHASPTCRRTPSWAATSSSSPPPATTTSTATSTSTSAAIWIRASTCRRPSSTPATARATACCATTATCASPT